MIKLPLDLDISALKDAYHDLVRTGPRPVRKPYGYHGWSLLSWTGDYQDGWTDYSGEVGGEDFDAQAAKARGWHPETEATAPTPLCVGVWAEALRAVIAQGYTIARARIAVLGPGRELAWHREAPEGQGMQRLHIAIITWPKCEFRTSAGAFQIPADGAGYLVRVDQLHKAVNYSRAERAHLMMTVWRRATA
jgi:hypothetical protein